ncbi:TOG array regulator of axonemal microtubules protein 1-like [Podargus strigoides]
MKGVFGGKADLVTVLYARKPGTVEQKVLGVLWQLLGNTRRSGSLQGADGDIQAATAKLARALYTEMVHSNPVNLRSRPQSLWIRAPLGLRLYSICEAFSSLNESMQNSLRYLRIAVAKKRAELMRSLPSLENPGPALNRDRSGESPPHASCPSLGSCSRSGIYSQGSLTSPAPAAPRRRRRTSDTFPLLGSKPQPARVSSGRSRDSKGAEDNFSPDGVSLETQAFYKGQAPPATPRPEVMDPSELQPFSKPEEALTEALALLAEENWEKKIEGLNFVRRLSAYHATVLTAELHEISLAVAQEVKNLRSGVSRAAVVCLGDLFTCLKKSMDSELDNAVKVLLHKAGEAN